MVINEGMLQCKDERVFVTTCPPLPVAWGTSWWVRLDDVWIRLLARASGESLTSDVKDRLSELIIAHRAAQRNKSESATA